MLDDFYDVAVKKLEERPRIYISSISSSPQRYASYRDVWQAISFRPRVMRDVSAVPNATSMLMDQVSRLPIFIPPMGLIGVGHPDGELVFATASARAGIHYCISTATTRKYEDIVSAHKEEQCTTGKEGQLFFQLYVNSDAIVTSGVLSRIKGLGFKGLFITADTPVVGKRTEDRRLLARELLEAEETAGAAAKRTTGGRAAPGVLSCSLNWNDLEWIRREWDGPIAVKGIQCADDALQAANLGIEAIYLSNHGGRQLPDAPSCLETLLDIRTLYPHLLDRLEIYVDGSFSTGADVVKALCLGARAVGVGRPFFYAAAAYGVEGVTKAVESKCKAIVCPGKPQSQDVSLILAC